MSEPIIKRTTTGDADFTSLIQQLDYELWEELKEDQATYDQFNKVPEIKTAVIIYLNEKPAACGCFKQHSKTIVEIKRMYVDKPHRGKGLSKLVLQELEAWAVENNFINAVLETSIHFATARNLYKKCGYHIIPNYPPYTDLPDSVCMAKTLKP